MRTARLVLGRATEAGPTSWLLLTGMMVLAFAVRAEQAKRLATPQLLCDEFIYAELAKSFAEEGRLLFRGEPLSLSYLYPILLAPAWLAERMDSTYTIAKTINAGLMTVSVLPLYLLGRRLVSPGWALVAPALTLLLPMTLLSGLLMTESAFMPAFLFAVYAIALALERPTIKRQALVLAAIALATAVRTQGVVLIAVLPTALLLVSALELWTAPPNRRARFVVERLRPFWPTAALLSGVVLIYAVLAAARARGFGAYEEVLSANYSLGGAWRATTLHLADLILTTGLVPVSALILLCFLAGRDAGAFTPAERAFLGVAVAAVAWLAVQVGLFTSQFAGGVAERYVFYAMPLLFLALVVWLARGLPRAWLPTSLAAAVPVGIVFVEPWSAVLSPSLLPSSLGLFAFHRISTDLGGGVDDLVWLVRVGAVAAALAFAVLWRPIARIAIPLGLAAFLLVSTRPAAGQLRQHATNASGDPGLNPNPEWINDRVGDTSVGYVYTAGSDAYTSSRTMLQVGFWNPSVRSVIRLSSREACALPARDASVDAATGRIRAVDSGGLPRHVVAHVELGLAGTLLAQQGPLVLYRVAPPLSLLQSLEGVHPDGWMGAKATYTRYRGPGPGRAVVKLSREFYTAETVRSAVRIAAWPVVVEEDGSTRMGRPVFRRRSTIDPGEKKTIVIPVGKPPLHVTVHIAPTYSAAGFGAGDTREISAQVSFGFEPEGER